VIVDPITLDIGSTVADAVNLAERTGYQLSGALRSLLAGMLPIATTFEETDPNRSAS
jgi:hypothetical protein